MNQRTRITLIAAILLGLSILITGAFGNPKILFIVGLAGLWLVPAFAIPIHLFSDFQNNYERYVTSSCIQEAGARFDQLIIGEGGIARLKHDPGVVSGYIGQAFFKENYTKRDFIQWSLGMGAATLIMSWFLILGSFSFDG